jgi:hypothetical protein
MYALMQWGMRRTREGATEEGATMSLSGRFAFRRSLSGKIVLKVEEEVKVPWPLSRTAKSRRRWRDARLSDLAEAEMRTLMDMRNQPQLVPKSAYVAALAHVIRLRDQLLPDDTVTTIEGVNGSNGHAPTSH